MSRYSRLNNQAGHNPADLNNMPTNYPGYAGSEDIPLKTNTTGNWTQVDSEQHNYGSKNSSKDDVIQSRGLMLT